MTHDQLLKNLEQLAFNSGITVRFEKGEFEGGFCVLRSERIILVNKKLNVPRKASILAQAVAEIGIDELYLKPAVREFIEDELARVERSS
jgi:hypothetical protein